METEELHIAQQIAEEQQTFRNELASINPDGTRKWVYVQETHGRYTKARNVVAYTLLAFLFTAPFLRIHGNPFVLFNVLERKFIIFGVVFWTQDFYLVVLGLLTFILGIAVFTSILGRIWCGWTCPQTIFLEFVFRKIERAIEGNARQQMALDKTPINFSKTGFNKTGFNKTGFNKIARKALKHTVFLVLSWVICNLFLSYIIGTEELFRIITDPPEQHAGGLAAMVVFSGLFYGVFARFREQACLVACPYGRFMSALVDADTVAVTYDYKRGEPRRKPSKADKINADKIGVSESRGDCIDCGQCISVCPTAIDIRNGIQLECVNCTACIDACDSVMTKIKKPTGLIRYTSANAVNTGSVNHFTTRIKGYIAVLLVMITLVTTLFLRRPEMEAIVMRQPGTLFQQVGQDKIANFYSLQLINKTFSPKTAEIRVLEPQEAVLTSLGDYHAVSPQNVQHGRFFVAIPKTMLRGTYNTIKLGVFADGKQIKEVKTTFLAPEK